MDTDNAFHVSILGQIETATFPLGAPCAQLFARFDIVAGADWELLSGVATGITQCATARDVPNGGDAVVVFNMPVEAMFKAMNPHGCRFFLSSSFISVLNVSLNNGVHTCIGPQIVVSLYGRNWWGRETAQGYCRLHAPLGARPATVKAPILNVRSTNIWNAMLGWVSDQRPELKDPRVLADGDRLSGLQLESYGELAVRLQTVQRGTQTLGLDWGQSRGQMITDWDGFRVGC